MQKDKYEWLLKGVTIGIPIGAFVIILLIASVGVALPAVLIGWFWWMAWKGWKGRKGNKN